MKKKFLTKPGVFRYILPLIFCLLSMSSALAQEKLVTGTVISADDEMPIPGVNVIIEGTSRGTTTDFDGFYELRAAVGEVIRFSYLGFQTRDVVVGEGDVYNVSLQTDTNQLDDVVVVGYGTQRRALVTGANVQVSGDDIQNQSRTNALQALQGQTPGVQITTTSGQPGSGLDVVIRGLGSTGDNSPLYVVDGVLTGDISYLNPADIESISVLKDAASAAIYGSQASNGVVLVTTRGGRKNTSVITFDQYYGLQSVPDKIDILNSREYAIIMNESAVNSGSQPLFTPNMIDELGEGTDYIDRMFVDNAVTQNYSLGFSGGSETSTFSSSLAYTQEEGVVGGADLSNYERYNFRLNSEHELYEGFITFGQNLTFAYSKSNGISVGNQYSNSLRGAFGVPPLVPEYDEEGNFYNTVNDQQPWLSGWANPYASMVLNNQNSNNNQKLLGNVYAEMNFSDNFRFRTMLGLDYYASGGHSYLPIYQLSIYSFRDRDRVYQSQSKGHSLLWDNLLTYEFDLEEDHHFEVLAGTSSYKFEGTYISGSNVDLIFNTLRYSWLDNALNNSDAALMDIGGGPNNINKRMSYFGRLNYNFQDKYLLNTTFRADGSSNFAPGNRWGYFPSISAGWIASEEDFLINSDAINFLKFRASWGQVGNQNAGAFQYLAPVTFAQTNYNFGPEGELTPGAYPSRLANPDLRWETSEQTNIGFDARFFLNRLSVNFDLYQKVTRDWLIRAPILATAGADAPFINGGDVTNKGVELAIAYRESIGDFNFNLSVNGAYNRNRVGNIPTDDGIIHGETNQLFDNSPEFYRAESGFPLGYFWGLETGGVFQTEEEIRNYRNNGRVVQPNARPGDLIYIDQNGDGIINDQDKVSIGDPNPDLTYGFNISLDYKGFDFSLLANGVAGNQLVQSYRNQASPYASHTTAIFDRWTGPGSSNTVPRLTLDNRNFTQFSDIYVQDGDFLRLSNLTVGYDLAKLSENFQVKKLRIYFSALNLYTFTNYNGMDPEVGYGISGNNYNFSSGVDLGYYPRPRTFLAGLNVTF